MDYAIFPKIRNDSLETHQNCFWTRSETVFIDLYSKKHKTRAQNRTLKNKQKVDVLYRTFGRIWLIFSKWHRKNIAFTVSSNTNQ